MKITKFTNSKCDPRKIWIFYFALQIASLIFIEYPWFCSPENIALAAQRIRSSFFPKAYIVFFLLTVLQSFTVLKNLNLYPADFIRSPFDFSPVIDHYPVDEWRFKAKLLNLKRETWKITPKSITMLFILQYLDIVILMTRKWNEVDSAVPLLSRFPRLPFLAWIIFRIFSLFFLFQIYRLYSNAQQDNTDPVLFLKDGGGICK